MTRRFVLPLLAAALTLAACEQTADPGSLDTLDEKVAYIVGHDLGMALHNQMEQLESQSVELDNDLIVEAVRNGLNGDTLLFSQSEVDSLMRAFQDTLVARQSLANLRESEAFLTETAALDSVQATDSGLLYKILAEGEGDSPQLGDTVVVNYRGTLPDSTEFDSSFNRGQPQRFVVGNLVPGWNEALQLMKPGAEYELYIPADLAYGEQAPPAIGPNRALIFQIQLLDVMPGPDPGTE